jgi:hypothetical protein
LNRACPQGIVFFLIVRSDQEKAIKENLSALRVFAVQKIELWTPRVSFNRDETMCFLLFHRDTVVKGNAHFTGEP